MPRTALVDGDIIVYSCGFASDIREWHCPDGTIFSYNKEAKEYCDDNGLDKEELELKYTSSPLSHTLHNVKLVLNKILKETDTKQLVIYLTGKTNFRNEIPSPLEYKGNRDKSHKPTQYKEIIEFLLANYNTIITNGEEADDAMGIEQSSRPYGDTVICTKDKDLDMISGLHYNLTKNKEPYEISEEQAIKSFYIQLLTGDRVDNIQGIKGIGNKKASKILDGIEEEKELLKVALEQYERAGFTKEDLINNGRLLWIRRKNREMWTPNLDF
jgi:5'-3' exonuclease